MGRRHVFLLHSLGLDAHSWAPLVGAAGPLLPDAELIPVDLLGHGSRSATEFSVAAAAAEVLSAARSCGTHGGLHLIGSGLGALIALHIAAQSDAASLVLAGWPPAAAEPGPSRADLVAAAVSAGGAKAFAEQYLDGLGTIGPHRRGLVEAMVTSSTRGLIPAIRAAEAWRPPAGGVFPSTLIVRGAQDVRVSEQAARGFADLLGGRFVEIPDAGHLAYIDRPERFAAVVADFHHGLG